MSTAEVVSGDADLVVVAVNEDNLLFPTGNTSGLRVDDAIGENKFVLTFVWYQEVVRVGYHYRTVGSDSKSFLELSCFDKNMANSYAKTRILKLGFAKLVGLKLTDCFGYFEYGVVVSRATVSTMEQHAILQDSKVCSHILCDCVKPHTVKTSVLNDSDMFA